MKQKQILSLLTAAALTASGALSVRNPAPARTTPFTVSAAEIAAASDFVGTWRFYKQIIDGEEYTHEQSDPDEYYYVMNQDGTGESIRIFSQEGMPDDSYMEPTRIPFTWKSSGNKITITYQPNEDDPNMPVFEPTVMTLENGVLVREEHDVMGAIDTLIEYYERVDGIPNLPAETEPPAVTTTTTTTTAVTTTAATTTKDKAAILSSVLTIEQMPYKTIYRVGEPLDLTGGLVTCEGKGIDSNGDEYNWKDTSVKMTNLSVKTSYDTQDPDKYKVILEDREGKASFDVWVIAENAGDVNLDGKITMDDYDMIREEVILPLVGGDPMLTGVQRENADVDGDGEVTAADFTMVESMIDQEALLAEHAAEFTTPAVTTATVTHTETVQTTAAEPQAEDAVIEVGKAYGMPGDTVALPITVKSKKPFSTLSLNLVYEDALILKKKDSGGVEYSYSGKGSVSVSENAGSYRITAELLSSTDMTECALTLYFKISEDARVGSVYSVKLMTDNLSLSNSSGETISYQYLDGYVSLSKKPPLDGDLNGDGKVTVSDAILLARIVAEDSTLTVTPVMMEAADYDRDGYITVEDTVKLLRVLVGLK